MQKDSARFQQPTIDLKIHARVLGDMRERFLVSFSIVDKFFLKIRIIFRSFAFCEIINRIKYRKAFPFAHPKSFYFASIQYVRRNH